MTDRPDVAGRPAPPAEAEGAGGELALARERAAHLGQVLKAIRSVNHLMAQEDDPQRLIEGACATLTRTMGYHSAWIALLDDSARLATATASSGIGGGFGVLRERLEGGAFPSCARLALEGDEVVVVGDPSTHCTDCPLCPEYGNRAAFCRRLAFDGKDFGLLAVSVPSSLASDEEARAWFDGLAGDLGFALNRIEETRRKRELEGVSASLFENNHAIMLLLDPADGTIVDANPAAERFYGWDRGELRGMEVSRINTLSPEEIHREMQAAREAQRNHFLFRHRRADGSVRDVEVYSGTIRSRERDLLYSIIHDITGRRQAEEALRESERYLRTILRTTADGFWVIDGQGLVIDVNEAYCAMSGYGREEILGMSIGDLDADETPSETRARIQRIEAEGSELFEARHRRKDGSVFSVEVSATYLGEGGGRFVCFCRELTERKEREERLSLLAQMLDTAPGAITVHDREGRFLFANRKALAIHGYEDAKEFMAVNLHELDVPESEALVEERVRKIERDGEASFEVAHFRKDGTRFPMEVLAKSIEWHGEPGILSVATEITERKRLEDQFRQAQKMEAVGRLAGGVAHDFNNMLNVILGHAELVLGDLPPGHPIQEDLQEIRKAAQRSAELTRQLLAFARRQTVELKVVDLNATIESLLRMLGRLIGEDIDLLWEPGKALSPIRIDPTQLDQILANLVVNARDAIGHAPGKITIETDQVEVDEDYCATHAGLTPGRYVVLAVSDDGCGMDEETRALVFEPFYTTKGRGEGTGLGLATVYGIVQQNQGLIHVYSEPGEGSTFRICLPAWATEGEGRKRETAEAAPPARGHETVLLVEDEPAILALGARMLEKLGYRALTASTPGEAIALAREFSGEIHLLITDVVMPEMNGRELAKRLLSLNPSIKRLFMSGYTANVIAHHGVLEEGVNFLQKPFSLQGLGRKVREALDT